MSKPICSGRLLSKTGACRAASFVVFASALAIGCSSGPSGSGSRSNANGSRPSANFNSSAGQNRPPRDFESAASDAEDALTELVAGRDATTNARELNQAIADMFELAGDEVTVRERLYSMLNATVTDADAFVNYVQGSRAAGGQVIEIASPAASKPILSQQTGANCGLTVVFVNGIWNTADDYGESLQTVKILVRGFDPAAKVIGFYNKSAVDESSVFGGLLCPIVGNLSTVPLGGQSAVAWRNTVTQFCRQAGGRLVDLAEAGFQTLLNFASAVGLTDATDLALMLGDEIAAGRKVIIIAHSQGNYFARQAVNLLPAADRQSVGVIAVGSPKLTPGIPAQAVRHVSFCQDFVTGLTALPGSVSDVDPVCQHWPSDIGGIMGQETLNVASHSFVGAYLATGSLNRPRIEQALRDIPAMLTNSRCQPPPGPTDPCALPSSSITITNIHECDNVCGPNAPPSCFALDGAPPCSCCYEYSIYADVTNTSGRRVQIVVWGRSVDPRVDWFAQMVDSGNSVLTWEPGQSNRTPLHATHGNTGEVVEAPSDFHYGVYDASCIPDVSGPPLPNAVPLVIP